MKNTTSTHDFTPAGCVNQWAQDHDDRACWDAFLKHPLGRNAR